jgi:Domain of unknown function (DUF6894)
VPRFYFHLVDELLVPDLDGIDFVDSNAARAAAVEGIRGMICDQVKRGRLCLGCSMEIVDEAGERVAVLRFSDAVRIETSGLSG